LFLNSFFTHFKHDENRSFDAVVTGSVNNIEIIFDVSEIVFEIPF